MSLTLKPLSPACGVEVQGLDLRQALDAGTVAAVRKAFDDNIVLVFRQQELTESDQLRAAEISDG